MVGRPPKPSALRILDGDTRKLGANKLEAELKLAGDLPDGLPDMPPGLSPKARQQWKYLMGCAGADKLFREADAAAIAGVCEMYAGFMLAAKKGDYLKAEKLFGRYLNGADRLGLSPAARARLQLGEKEDDSKLKRPSPEAWKARKASVPA